MKVLGPNETGRGILIEYDAGHVSPDDLRNKKIITEIKDLPNDMGKVISYKVTNNASTYKEGDILTKTKDQLNILEGLK